MQLMSTVKSAVVWFPAALFVVHATLVAHVLSVLGRWPIQYEAPEIYALGNDILSIHEVIAKIGVLFLPLVCAAFFVHSRRMQEADSGGRAPQGANVIFVAPLVVWVLLYFISTNLSDFYGWLWD